MSNFRDLERTHRVTWHKLVDLEPKLAFLLWEARQACSNCHRWSDVERAFAPICKTLAGLVGFARSHDPHPVLSSSGAYEVAYWKLLGAVAALLPDGTGGASEAVQEPPAWSGGRIRSAEPAAPAIAGVDIPNPGIRHRPSNAETRQNQVLDYCI
jgi:hypothetical protein